MSSRTSRQESQSEERESIEEAPGLDAIMNRYDRQELIEGWDQKKLSNSNIVVAGTDILAQYVVTALSALGFGYMEIYGDGRTERGNEGRNETGNERMNERMNEKKNYSLGFINDGFFSNTSRNISRNSDGSNQNHKDRKAAMIAGFARKINPLIVANGVPLDLSYSKNLSVLNKPQIIFDATNDPASKIELLEYAMSNDGLFISLSSADNIGKFGLYDSRWRKSRSEKDKIINNILFSEMENLPQDPFTGMMISALAVDEARKYLMPIHDEKIIEDVIIHNIHSAKRFNSKIDRQISERCDINENKNVLAEKKVLMVGAGGLGNPVGLGLSMTDLGSLVIIDKDVVESTNLNRQPLFYNSVGREKASSLIEQLRIVNPEKAYSGIAEFIDLGYHAFFKKHNFDLIIDCVDNDKTRALLNYYSLKYEIPMISSATRHDSGHVNVSVPGKTSCLNCQREIDKYALQRYSESASCIYAPQASVITSNMTIAGMVVCEAMTILDPEKYGEPIGYELKYISRDDFRIGTLPLNKSTCGCYKSKRLDDWPEKMHDLYKK